jgi:hypothetical protein
MRFKIIVCCALIFSVSALFGADIGNLSYKVRNGGVIITNCLSSSAGELSIPPSIEDKPVTMIGENAFRSCSKLTNVVIPDTVIRIEDKAFYGCVGLTKLTVPNSVTSIGKYAFYACVKLAEVQLGKGLKSIGDWSFNTCVNMTRVTIPDNVTSIGDRAFFGCIKLDNITLGTGLNTIGDSAFRDCARLKGNLIIPDNVIRIGDYAFYRCVSLTGLSISKNLATIGDQVFYRCSKLTSVVIPKSVTSIGNYAFYRCASLASVTFEGNAPSVGSALFLNVAETASVYRNFSANGFDDKIGGLPVFVGRARSENLVYIIDSNSATITITDCDTKVSGNLEIPSSIENKPVISIGENAFRDCVNLNNVKIPDGIKTIKSGAFYKCTNLSNVNIPETIATIGMSAFKGTALANIKIPDTVTNIGSSVFRDCLRLTNIEVQDSHPVYAREAGMLLNKAKDVLLSYPSASGEITIPSTVKKIAYGAFAGSNVHKVRMSESVTTIEGNAFTQCKELREIFISKSVTAIGLGAFGGCQNLTVMTFYGDSPSQVEDVFKNEPESLLRDAPAKIHYNLKNNTWKDTWFDRPTMPVGL